MVAKAEPDDHESASSGSPAVPPEVKPPEPRMAVKMTAAKLYGLGKTRSQIARLMIDHLAGPQRDTKGRLWAHAPMDQRMRKARSCLMRWEAQQSFRDMIYDKAVIGLDLKVPAILEGIAKKAARGRVDAARLALEVTGRHNPKGEMAAPQVVVSINGIPRPQGEVVDGEAVEEAELEA